MTDLDDHPKGNIDIPSSIQAPLWLRVIAVVRWILLLPAAVIAFAFVSYSIVIIIGQDWHPGIRTNVKGFFSCFTFVAIGCLLAPAYRNRVAIVLAGFVTIVIAILLILGSPAISGNFWFFTLIGAWAAAGLFFRD